MSSTIALLLQIVSILAANNSYWTRCGGAQNRTGLTDEELLPLLLSNNPTLTLEDLDYTLKCGLRKGALRQGIMGPACVLNGVTTGEYFVNTNMLYENNANSVFLQVVPGLPIPKAYRQMPFVIY